MNKTTELLRPQKDEEFYNDDVFYGPRREAFRLIEFAKANNNPDCIVLVSEDTIVDKTLQWNIKNLVGSDKRLVTMVEALNVSHALPIQRFSWPQIHNSPFPFVCIAPKSSVQQQGTWLSRPVTLSSNSAIRTDNTNDDIDFSTLDEVVDQSTIAAGDEATDERASKDLNAMGYSDMQSYDLSPEDFIEHPKYIIICSSQNHVETISREINRMKMAAFGELSDSRRERISNAARDRLPPRLATIHVHQTDEKLAIKFNSCEVLITTPGALNKCIKLDLVDFSKSRRVFFDDIDLSLQLHNASIRDIVKLYVVQMHDLDPQATSENEFGQGSRKNALSTCKIHMFSRKWTDLLKQSINTVFRQHAIIFGSIAEASVYANLRFEIEYTDTNELAVAKLKAIVARYESTRNANDIMAITCRTNAESKSILSKLDNTAQNKAVVLETDSIQAIKMPGRHKGPVYIVSDGALEFTISDLNNVTHLVHFTVPDKHIVYDQRFRLMHRHLASSNSNGMVTTVFVRPHTSNEFVKELYDVLSRSSTTLRSTKLELRDLISEKSNVICWRWASTGLCRLEKLTKDDRFGSFCPDRHSILPIELYPRDERWPRGGQIKLTITHLINPNEFYFWFEAHRSKNSRMKNWEKFDSSGSEFMHSLQKKLNKFKSMPSRSIPLEKFNLEQIYGVYFRDVARVDRVVLLEKLSFEHLDPRKAPGSLQHHIPHQFMIRYDKEYDNLVQIRKIDYGNKVTVRLENIFALPESLASIESQCYRGFHLGVKPTDNEPDWLYKAKKSFYELVCVDQLREVTAWLRMQSGRCFWFDNMVVSRELPEIGHKATFKTFPHEELINKGLALKCTNEPSCLAPSDRLETLCKWEIENATKYAKWAFLRKDRDVNDIYLLHVVGRTRLDLWVRLASYNKLLIELEDHIRQDYERNQLQTLSYFDEGVLCVVRVASNIITSTGETFYEFNRCKIKDIKARPIIERDMDSVDPPTDNIDRLLFTVDCLDHGDQITVTRDDLYLAKADYLRRLPFQAIECTMADLDPEIFLDANLLHTIKELLYDSTRTETNQMRVIKCKLKEQRNELYLYLPIDGQARMYAPLIALFEQQGISVSNNDDPELRKVVEFASSVEDELDIEIEEKLAESPSEYVMRLVISEILGDIIDKQLGLESGEENEDEEMLVNGFSGVTIENGNQH